MKMALDNASGVNVIRSYERGSVQIRDRSFSNSLIVLPDEVIDENFFFSWQVVTVTLRF